MHDRFADVPTFGRDTIRRFGANVSAMKKLAARDFEDLLQVVYHEGRTTYPCAHGLHIITSALYQCSRGCSLRGTTGAFWTCCLSLQPGIHWPNYGCTPNRPSLPLNERRGRSVTPCANSFVRSAQTMLRRSFPKRPLRASAARQPVPRRPRPKHRRLPHKSRLLLLLNHSPTKPLHYLQEVDPKAHRNRRPRGNISTSTRTNFTVLGTIPAPSDPWAPLTAGQRRR